MSTQVPETVDAFRCGACAATYWSRDTCPSCGGAERIQCHDAQPQLALGSGGLCLTCQHARNGGFCPSSAVLTHWSDGTETCFGFEVMS
jgi:hypothetical protein